MTSSQDTIENRFPKLLEDQPASKDTLGAHKRIAIAISELIASETGGKTISIEGVWGSGKSTVVRLISNIVEKHSHMHVLVYDAWVHSGDPLRRAFLTSLIEKLLAKKWLSGMAGQSADSYWKKRQDELSRKIKTIEKRTTPLFTPFGKFLAFSFLLLPFSSPMFAEGVKKLLDTSTQKLADPSTPNPFMYTTGFWIFVAAAIATTLPFTLAILRIIIGKIRKESIDDIFSLLLNKSVSAENSMSIETPDPTTIEFQALFGEIMNDALQNKERRLALVIDNLDRLPEKEADTVWTLLRSFIDNPTFRGEPWFERIWVVVPVARSEVQRKFSPANEAAPKVQIALRDPEFFEKVFQVRFQLPPPVLADWQTHLERLLQEALGSVEATDFPDILRLFGEYLASDENRSRAPTPRELLLFVNGLVAYKLQWKSTFPLRTLAGYVLATQNLDILSALQQRSIPTKKMLRQLGPNLAGQFAAIYFNVEDTEKAQFLLRQPIIESCLKSGDTEALAKLLATEASVQHDLDMVLSKSLDAWELSDLNGYFNAIIAIAGVINKDQDSQELPNQAKISEKTKDLVILSGKRAYAQFHGLPLAVPNCARATSSFLKLCNNDPTLASEVMRAIRRMIDFKSEPQPEQPVVDVLPGDKLPFWLNGLELICENDAISSQLPIDINQAIPLPLEVPEWLEFCSKFSTPNYARIREGFTHRDKPEHLSTYIMQQITQNQFSTKSKATVLRELHTSNAKSLDGLFVTSAKLLSEQPQVGLNTLPALISTLKLLTLELPAAKKFVLDATEAGWLHHFFHRAWQEKLFDMAATFAIFILSSRPDGSCPSAFGESAAGADVLAGILSSGNVDPSFITSWDSDIELLSKHRLLIEISAQSSNSAAFVKAQLGRQSGNRILDAFDFESRFIAELNKVAANIYQDKHAEINGFKLKVLKAGIQRHNLITKVLDQFPKPLPIDFICLLFEAGGSSNERFTNFSRSILNEQPLDAWIDSLTGYTWITRFSLGVIRNSGHGSLDGPLREAIRHVAKMLVDNAEGKILPNEQFAEILLGVPDLSRAGLADDLYQDYCNHSPAPAPIFWERFGALMLSHAEGNEDLARTPRRLLMPILRNADAFGLDAYVTLIRKSTYTLPKIDEATRTDILNLAIRSIENAEISEEYKSRVRQLLDIFGMNQMLEKRINPDELAPPSNSNSGEERQN